MQITKLWLLTGFTATGLRHRQPTIRKGPARKTAPRLPGATHGVSDPKYVHNLYLMYPPCRILKTNRPDTWLVIFVVNAKSDATYVTFLTWMKEF